MTTGETNIDIPGVVAYGSNVEVDEDADMVLIEAVVRGAHQSTWITVSLAAARAATRGPWFARQLCKWAWRFIRNRRDIPDNIYRQWTTSRIEDEDVASEIQLHLQGLGKYIKAMDIVHYLDRPDTKAPRGQYIDSHKRDDVVQYQQEIFLPFFKVLTPLLHVWNNKDMEVPEPEPPPQKQRTVIWFHNESTFYANDCRKSRWVHTSETAVPEAKGEGTSLMVADFVSADYGWLHTPNGSKDAHMIFKAGVGRDGYFVNDNIVQQAKVMMDVVTTSFPDVDHSAAYDNATSHSKRPEGVLSARKMPHNIPKEGANWLVNVSVIRANKQQVYGPDRKPMKTKMAMGDGQCSDGRLQSLYFPPGHEREGVFKGMTGILEECGFNISKLYLKAQCGKSFNCKLGATDCCCRRILYNQPDFADGKSILELAFEARGMKVIFLLKFHPELNPIEQCWGAAKRAYHMYPLSSKAAEADLERNLLTALKLGLDRRQAAWANKKYHGHRTLPDSILTEFDEAQPLAH
ncbi:hypothetical protein B0H21DRAFT_781210 [Amylocystis lapponica]|nr:hypothetical protein B0H21DRAFT_781210 [Amylocystis lapponica]